MQHDAQLMQRRSMPMLHRAAQITPASYDPQASTVEVVWTTGARVRRMDPWTGIEFDEELLVTPEAVDMSRFDAGAVQVLDSHDRFSGLDAVIGIAESGWIDNGEGRALLRLSQREDLAGIVGDIGAGVIRNVSFGYSVQLYEVTPAAQRGDGASVPLYVAVKWRPNEISFVPVPADANAGTRQASPQFECEFRTKPLPRQQESNPMSQEADNLTRDQQVAKIREMAATAGRTVRLPGDFIEGLIARNLTPEQAGIEILGRMAAEDEQRGGHLNLNPDHGIVRDHAPQFDQQRELMADALAARAGGPALKAENPYRHASVVDMARQLLEARGVRTGGMSRNQVIERALHTTSDFPNLLQGTGNRVLRRAYESYPGGVKRIARATTMRDFRAGQRLALSSAPALLKVNEHGEFTTGTMAEAKESYSLATYGRIFGLSRQAMVNDDLGAFADMITRLGRAAAEFEASTLATLLTSNPTLANDSLTVFHATHGNLGTGAPSALSQTSLSTARAAMRLQKDLDGKTPIDATPTYLVVPAALETTGQQLLTAIQATKATDVNPFADRLELVVDPRLDASSVTAWYLAADPGLIDTIEYAHLDGEEGPQIFVQEGFEVDGVQMKVREDFGAAILDFRGLYKANGA